MSVQTVGKNDASPSLVNNPTSRMLGELGLTRIEKTANLKNRILLELP